MSEAFEELFQDGIRRYQAGEAAADLIPTFEQICKDEPKAAAAWTCLAWLHLLAATPDKALKAAQKAVKLDPVDAQSRINLALAMLELGKTGVRKEIEIVQQILARDPEQLEGIDANFADGQTRRPEWNYLTKVKTWLSGE